MRIVLTGRAKLTFLDWIPFRNRFCGVSQELVGFRKDSFALFVISAYHLMDGSSNMQRGEFYVAVANLVNRSKRSAIAVMASASHVQVGGNYCIGSFFRWALRLPGQPTNNG